MSDDHKNVTFAAELTAAWLANPNTRASAEEVPAFLRSAFEALQGLRGPVAAPGQDEPAPQEYMPAVSVRKSLANPDHILSMLDGKPYKTLRRHLSTNGLTPDEYRRRYGLKPDYPMTAASYSEARSAMAKQIGLGRKPKPVQSEAPAEPAKQKRGGRKSGTDALSAAKARFAKGKE